jgi:two-component system sensor histidine kinase UhpB
MSRYASSAGSALDAALERERSAATNPLSPPELAPAAPAAYESRPGLAARLLSLPLFYKVLIANSTIVLLGALAGTAITLHVAGGRHPAGFDAPLAAIFAGCGLALTAALNALVLRAALSPLARLQEVARSVRAGDLSVRATPSPLADAEVAQLADTLNQILDEVQRHQEQLRALSARVIRAQEDERQRIARELHDDTGQVLTLLLIRLKLLEAQAPSEALQAQITELRGLVSGAIDQVRRLALNLRPPSLDQLGLAPALRSLVSTVSASTRIPAQLDLPSQPVPLTPERTIAVYRVAQEALTNAVRHAGASAISLRLSLTTSALELEVRDDGHGFEPAAFAAPARHGAPAAPGVGLFGMEERARLAGGSLRIQSAPGRGTLVRLHLPLDTHLPGASDEPPATFLTT